MLEYLAAMQQAQFAAWQRFLPCDVTYYRAVVSQHRVIHYYQGWYTLTGRELQTPKGQLDLPRRMYDFVVTCNHLAFISTRHELFIYDGRFYRVPHVRPLAFLPTTFFVTAEGQACWYHYTYKMLVPLITPERVLTTCFQDDGLGITYLLESRRYYAPGWWYRPYIPDQWVNRSFRFKRGKLWLQGAKVSTPPLRSVYGASKESILVEYVTGAVWLLRADGSRLPYYEVTRRPATCCIIL